MEGAFRLLNVSGAFGRQYPEDADRSTKTVFFSPHPEDSQDSPWVSVVIGKNGIGKSRLLAGLADLLSGELPRGASGVDSVSYTMGSKECRLELNKSGRVTSYVDGQIHDQADTPLPSKVIAITTTPFDKFRIPKSLLASHHAHVADERERYSYLGLRDRTGRASPTAVIFRALEGLFGASRSVASRRARVAAVFKFLGYQPRVAVRYRLTATSRRRLKQILDGERLDFPTRLVQAIERNPEVLEQVRSVAQEFLARAGGRDNVVLMADFESHSSGKDEEFFRNIQLLRKTGVVTMQSVEVQRIGDGAVLDLKLASSGELGIVTGILGIASVIEDNSIVLVDEPEISLHPEWQAKYVDLLLKTFQGYKGCHFVLATHSPLVLSDISPDRSTVVLMDSEVNGKAVDAEDYAGQSSDHLLATAFQSPGNNNLYLKQELIKALRLAADGMAGTPEFDEVLHGMLKLTPSLDKDSPATELIRQLQLAQVEATR